jgi:endonuclease YncB( thermonuclease family)
VRAHIYKRDQYDRVVATVYVRRPPFLFLRRDVGYEMLKRGLATTYEAKTGVEFGGPIAERRYRAAEQIARMKGRGMWASEKGGLFGLGKGTTLESPREYKTRVKMEEGSAGKNTAKKV